MTKIGSYSFEEYLQIVEFFHGNTAPGLVIGGFMVDLATRRIPEGVLFDAICETTACLPDAIQLLTPCTVGNGWLKIFRLGRFALSLYDKYQGDGVRVFLDAGKLELWPEIKAWLYKLKPKQEEDKDDKGLSEKDPTLQNPRCVFQLLKQHYSRYDRELCPGWDQPHGAQEKGRSHGSGAFSAVVLGLAREPPDHLQPGLGRPQWSAL